MNYFSIPLEKWTNIFIKGWFMPKFGDFFDKLGDFFGVIIDAFTDLLIWIPPEVITIIFVLLAWWLGGKGLALGTFLGFLFIGSVDIWVPAMQTLAIVLNATLFSIMIGIPLGVWGAKSDRANKVIRPILDFMQTLPSFVYLIPTILLFGIGTVPAVIATFVFATPPAVRFTTLGIKQVPEDVVEAAKAFGSTSWQTLRKVQFPLAMTTIIAGINQTIMLALSMAVIASMIGAPGLGEIVFGAIGRVNTGLGLVGGLGIVVLAIVLDRLTEGISKRTKF